MPVISFIHRMERIDQLVRTQATGTPGQFAGKLGISKRCLHLWLSQLKDDFGFPIAYDADRQTYYYTKQGRFAFGFREA